MRLTEGIVRVNEFFEKKTAWLTVAALIAILLASYASAINSQPLTEIDNIHVQLPVTKAQATQVVLTNEQNVHQAATAIGEVESSPLDLVPDDCRAGVVMIGVTGEIAWTGTVINQDRWVGPDHRVHVSADVVTVHHAIEGENSDLVNPEFDWYLYDSQTKLQYDQMKPVKVVQLQNNEGRLADLMYLRLVTDFQPGTFRAPFRPATLANLAAMESSTDAEFWSVGHPSYYKELQVMHGLFATDQVYVWSFTDLNFYRYNTTTSLGSPEEGFSSPFGGDSGTPICIQVIEDGTGRPVKLWRKVGLLSNGSKYDPYLGIVDGFGAETIETVSSLITSEDELMRRKGWAVKPIQP